MKEPYAFIRVPYMNSYNFGVIGPGFLNRVSTSCLEFRGLGLRGLGFRVLRGLVSGLWV